jgi:hypothetical protein
VLLGCKSLIYVLIKLIYLYIGLLLILGAITSTNRSRIDYVTIQSLLTLTIFGIRHHLLVQLNLVLTLVSRRELLLRLLTRVRSLLLSLHNQIVYRVHHLVLGGSWMVLLSRSLYVGSDLFHQLLLGLYLQVLSLFFIRALTRLNCTNDMDWVYMLNA